MFSQPLLDYLAGIDLAIESLQQLKRDTMLRTVQALRKYPDGFTFWDEDAEFQVSEAGIGDREICYWCVCTVPGTSVVLRESASYAQSTIDCLVMLCNNARFSS